MIKNIFIIGPPGCGKTTLIEEILKELKIPAKEFFTKEIRIYIAQLGDDKMFFYLSFKFE